MPKRSPVDSQPGRDANSEGSSNKRQRNVYSIAPDFGPASPITPLSIGSFYNVQVDKAPVGDYLDACLQALPDSVKGLLQQWSRRFDIIEKRFKTDEEQSEADEYQTVTKGKEIYTTNEIQIKTIEKRYATDDKEFKTLDYAVKILQTHQADRTIVCSLLRDLTSKHTSRERIKDLYDQVNEALKVFSAHGGRKSRTPSTSSSSAMSSLGDAKSHVDRGKCSKMLKEMCIKRDGGKSVLSQASLTPDLAHIIPHSAKGDKMDMFWKLIKMFSGEETEKALRNSLYGRQGDSATDNLKNVMLLDASEHRAFDSHRWELVPDLGDMVAYDPKTCSEYQARFSSLGKKLLGYYTRKQTDEGEILDAVIDTGHIVTLKTNDPQNLPLPHPLLLQLHSICTRIIYLKAGAGYPPTESEESDYESVCQQVSEHEGVEWLEESRGWGSLQDRLRVVPQLRAEDIVEGWRNSLSPRRSRSDDAESLPERNPDDMDNLSDPIFAVDYLPTFESMGDATRESRIREKAANGKLQTPTPAASTGVSRKRKSKTAQFDSGDSQETQGLFKKSRQRVDEEGIQAID